MHRRYQDKNNTPPQLGPITEQASESPPHNVGRSDWLTDWLTIGSRRLEIWKKAFFWGGEEKKPNIWFDVPNKKLGIRFPNRFCRRASRDSSRSRRRRQLLEMRSPPLSTWRRHLFLSCGFFHKSPERLLWINNKNKSDVWFHVTLVPDVWFHVTLVLFPIHYHTTRFRRLRCRFVRTAEYEYATLSMGTNYLIVRLIR